MEKIARRAMKMCKNETYDEVQRTRPELVWLMKNGSLRGEWPSQLYSLCQVTEVKLGRDRSNSGWVTSEA